MRYSIYRFALFFMLCSVPIVQAQESCTRDNLDILFVGNSYTYYWNLPQTIKAMARADKLTWNVRHSTLGDSSLKDHWNEKAPLKTRSLIVAGSWDYVVLQNHSKSTIDTPDEFDHYGSKLIQWIKDTSAEPVLYMTWGRKHLPEMIDTVSQKYRQLAEKNNIDVVPVGEAWSYLAKSNPELELYAPDKSHPSPLGTYTNAVLFYQYFCQAKNLNISRLVTTTNAYKEKTYLLIIPKQQAIAVKSGINDFLEKN